MFSLQEMKDAISKIEKLEKITQARGATPAEESVARTKIVELKIKYKLNVDHQGQFNQQSQLFREIDAALRHQQQFFDQEQIANFDSQVIVVPVINDGKMTYWVNGHEFFSSQAAHVYAQQCLHKQRK